MLTNPFGRSVDGIPSGLFGWTMGALGMVLIIGGTVLHIVATSRRKRVDRELSVSSPWLGAGPAGRASTTGRTGRRDPPRLFDHRGLHTSACPSWLEQGCH